MDDTIRDKVFTAPADGLGGDALQVWGKDGNVTIERCVFDFRGVPLDEQDEALDCIKGAHVRVRGCAFIGCKKAALNGNGDYPQEDRACGEALYKDCVFIGCGRRCPEAQDGVAVRMEHCWIHNWGAGCFDVRTFGARVSSGASLTAMECLFSRSRGIGFRNAVVDIANQFGQTVNEYGLACALAHPLQAAKPGTRRPVDVGFGGHADVFSCWTNVPGLAFDYAMPMETAQARKDVYGILHEIKDACPDLTPYLKMPVDEYFVHECGEVWTK